MPRKPSHNVGTGNDERLEQRFDEHDAGPGESEAE
jgi:hypothetical protein